jgi:hypothetical protein
MGRAHRTEPDDVPVHTPSGVWIGFRPRVASARVTAQSPVADPERPTPTRRSADAARRRVIARRRAAVGIGILAVVGIAAFALLGGNVPLIDGPQGPGGFSFDLGNVRASPITRTPPADLQDVAREAGEGVKATMDELYFLAFLDTGSWGDYAAAFELFEGAAARRAEADAAVLTLGPTARDEFESMGAASGTLLVSVLTDADDEPVTAVAEVQFQADAEGKDGSTTEVVSVGSFFLREVDGAWRIFAYRVDRADETVAASPSGSPS